MEKRKESDLYGPVKALLQEQGYEVKGEVNGCDLVGVRGDEVVVVELKVAFNLTLVLQGIARQRLTEAVYLAVEQPRSTRNGPRWSELTSLCRRLGLGLMTVSFSNRRAPRVEVVCDPGPFKPHQLSKPRGKLLKEFQHRTGDHNTGGTTKRPLVTAYREACLWVAHELSAKGPLSPKALRAATGNPRVGQMLQDDVYGWFERVQKGIYRLSAKGEQALAQYADVVAQAAAAAQTPEG